MMAMSTVLPLTMLADGEDQRARSKRRVYRALLTVEHHGVVAFLESHRVDASREELAKVDDSRTTAGDDEQVALSGVMDAREWGV